MPVSGRMCRFMVERKSNGTDWYQLKKYRTPKVIETLVGS